MILYLVSLWELSIKRDRMERRLLLIRWKVNLFDGCCQLKCMGIRKKKRYVHEAVSKFLYGLLSFLAEACYIGDGFKSETFQIGVTVHHLTLLHNSSSNSSALFFLIHVFCHLVFVCLILFAALILVMDLIFFPILFLQHLWTLERSMQPDTEWVTQNASAKCPGSYRLLIPNWWI